MKRPANLGTLMLIVLFAFASPDRLRSTVPARLPKMYILEPIDGVKQPSDQETAWESKALEDLGETLNAENSLKGVSIEVGSGSMEALYAQMEHDGAELLGIKVFQTGDDLHFKLNVEAHALHPSKPYVIAIATCKASEGAGKCLDHHLPAITEVVRDHHRSCHLEGSCQ